MTSINKLTQTPTLEDNDLSVVWQNSSGRTRAITIENLRHFIQSTDPNADAFVKAELVGDELVLTAHDETETRIDINILPEHSVTELSDMPDTLVSGEYLKVSDDGNGFVLTPASEISAAILVREDGQLKGSANVLDFGNATISLENRIANIKLNVQFANTRTMIFDDNEKEYLSVDRTSPVIVTEEIDSLVLCKTTDPEGETDAPKVRKGTVGELASGFSVCPDGTAAGTQILQASSGTYSLTTMIFAVGAAVDDPVYVGPDGKLTLDQSDYVVGWVLTDGVIIDIDLYNATVKAKNEQPDLSNYVEKYSKAELNYIQLAYDGKYGDDRKFYPTEIKQDVNGWTQEQFTGVRIFQSKDKNSGALGDKILELGTSRVDLNKPSYVQGKRIAERTTHNIYNTYSLSDLIKPDSESFTDWMASNPDYTQMQFLSTLFSCTVLGSSNWVVSATTSGEDYNGTFPSGYQQIEIHRNGGGSRSFLRSYNKESSVHYFANYKANTELSWKQYAYTSDLVALKDKVSYDNEIQNIDTNGSGVFAEYLGFGSTSAQHTHTFDESGVFWISNLQSSTRNKVVNVTSSRGSELTGISVPFNRVVKFTYSSEIEEIITEASYADVDINSNTRNSYSGQGLGTPKPISVGDGDKYLTEPVGYYISQPDKTGNLTIYVDDTGGYNEFRVIYDNADNKPRDIKVSTDGIKDSTKTIQTGEVWECRVSLSRGSLDQNTFFWTRLDSGESGYILDGQFNSKSGYSKLVSGGGSTHTITYSENGSILKISNPTVKVQLLQGMSNENPHGYIKYINSHNADVAFEWYDRAGSQVTNNVPSVCPADTVVEIFADYAKNEYVLSFGQSKVIQSINENDELMEGLASGVIYAKTVTVG